MQQIYKRICEQNFELVKIFMKRAQRKMWRKLLQQTFVNCKGLRTYKRIIGHLWTRKRGLHKRSIYKRSNHKIVFCFWTFMLLHCFWLSFCDGMCQKHWHNSCYTYMNDHCTEITYITCEGIHVLAVNLYIDTSVTEFCGHDMSWWCSN